MNTFGDNSATGDGHGSTPVSDSKGQAHSGPIPSPKPPIPRVLAVDCGLRTGLALFELTGQLLWYRSHNLGNRQRLKRAAWQLLHEIEGLTHLVVEGGGNLAEIWLKTAERCGIMATQIHAEVWRQELLLPRQQRTGKQAKEVADELAREIIAASGASKPTSLRHDAAEAVLVGWWFLQKRR